MLRTEWIYKTFIDCLNGDEWRKNKLIAWDCFVHNAHGKHLHDSRFFFFFIFHPISVIIWPLYMHLLPSTTTIHLQFAFWYCRHNSILLYSLKKPLTLAFGFFDCSICIYISNTLNSFILFVCIGIVLAHKPQNFK